MRTVFPPLFTVLSIVICEFCTRSYQQEVVLPGGEEEETHRSKYLANFQYENQSKNKLGCMFSDNLCNSEEICFDDLIFGRCISVTEDPTENELERFPDLSEADKALITSELDQLEEAGLAWDDFFTQCILQNILGSIQFGSEFAESDCNIFLAPAQSDLDLGEDDLGYDLGNEEIPEGFLESADADGDADVAADIPSGAVPKKTPFSDDLSSVEEAPSSEDEATLTIDEQPDGSLIINSNNEELLGEYLESLSAEGDQDLNPEEGESLVPAKRSVPQIVDSEEMIPENPFANTRDYLDMQNFLELRDAANAAAQEEAMLEDLEKMREAEQEQLFRIQQEEEAEEEERRRAAEALEAEMEASYQPSQEEVFPPMEQLSDYPEMVPTSQMRKLRKRTQDAAAAAPSAGDAANFYYQQLTPGQEPLFYAPEEEMVPQIDAGRDYPDYPLPGYPDDSDESYSEPEPNYLPESENNYPDYENDYENDYAGVAVPEGTVNRVRGGGLESNIFNRNGRLDVKKPGPFFPNSANNFFLDKLLNSDDEKEGKTNETDVGQVEYEMPLLAPVKDKRDLVLDQEIVDRTPAEPGFVHIILKKRFDTWHQGANFIKVLAEEFGVPDHALDAREIEDHHVQFHVSSNPQNIDAHQMAKRIDEDGDLRERINAQTGVVIGRAAAGEQHDVTSSLFPSGANLNLLLLTVVTASAAAALLVIGLVALCVRKRTRASKVKKADSEEAEKGKAQEEYQQLCRDWSRTSKKLESGSTKATNPTTTAVKKQMQQRDSKDSECSNRSSTSSWPEEPNTTNMDISTGHMVLAYMEDHLKNKQRLEQEWVALCSYEAEPCATTIAFKAENKKKNRYPDKLPYDHNRVILNAMVNGTNSDYANASTVTDHDPRNPSYIVSQAPLANTVADFWQMIWEQGCVVIVMLTRLQDNGHQLCQRYWPEEGSEQYHIFEVHLVSEHVWCDDYLVRSVYLKNTRTGETRTVTQFHFRSWPAHGVPTSTKALLEFRRKVNKSYRGRSCPIAVHCSDGVGRSGTYILIDMVLNRMSKGCKEIDIAATLEHIRDQRGGMVATRQQFEFCLMAVAEEVHAILKALPQ